VREFKDFGRDHDSELCERSRYSSDLSVVMDGGIEPEKVLDQIGVIEFGLFVGVIKLVK
jgi:hypothetical protein